MNSFVRLELYDAVRDEYVERWFNIGCVRHVEPDTNRVMLTGAKVAVVVSTRSMDELVRMIKSDGVLMSRMCYVLDGIRRELCMPWYKRLWRSLWKRG